jgi:lysophospholipase L1-like esterase
MWQWIRSGGRRRGRRPGHVAMAVVVASAGAMAAVVTTPPAHGQTTAVQATTLQASQTAQGTMRVLVMGDSYSAGNGAGDYSGAAGCYRSSRNYAQDFAAILRGKAYSQPTTVTNVACSGAVTADFFNPRSGRPPEISYVNSSYDVIFLTIGGNDVKFSDVVTGCLIKGLRDGATCASKLSYAENLLANGTMRTRITNVLKAVRAKANPLAKIVLLGYPFLEGDTGYTLLAGKTVVHVGQRLHAIGVAGDALDQSIVTTLNAANPDRPFTFVSVHNLYDGPPYHGLYATRSNPNRWMVQPPTEIYGSTAIRQTWYHPNPTGWLEESKLLAATASVPKHPLTGPVITPTTMPVGYVGRRYVALLSTADGRSGRWRLAGSLPAGLRLDGADIVGTPARPQDVSFRAGFTDSYGDSATATITLDVRPQVSGTVAAFGDNGLGELGNGQANCMSDTPTRIPGLSGVTAVASDADTSYALTATGAVWAWGADGDGQLGNGTVDGTSIGQPTPTLVSGLPKIVTISAGQFDGYALDASGNVWAWGNVT